MKTIQTYLTNLFASVLLLIGLTYLVSYAVPDTNVWYLVWPLFILIPGVLLVGECLIRQKDSWYGLYIFGMVMIFTSIIFYLDLFTGWAYSHSLWLVFWIIVAGGFMLLYRKRKMTFYRNCSVFFVLVGIFFALVSYGFAQYLIPLLLIGIGLGMMRKKN